MVSFSGVCKVSGYGALGVAPRERSGRRVRSRRLYIAPEQLMGGREASSVLTDVFLLGLLLYECLSGRKPFQDSIEPDKAILNRPLPPLPAEVPLAYNEVVRRATAKRAGDRYPSALAFREALVAAAGELPSSAAFAELIAKLLPPDSETRAARKRTIDKGLEELARNVPVGPSPLTAGSAAPVAPSIPSETPPVRDEDPDDSEAPDRPAAAPARRSSAPLAAAIGALLLVSAVGTVWSIRQESAPTVPGAVAMATGEEPRFDTPVLLEAAPKAPADTGGRVASNAGTAAPPAPAVPPTPVEILVNPDVAVSVDGRAVGRSPLTVPLAPGRHMLTFLDEARGLRTARMIDVRSTPDTVTFRIRLGMGSILVHAPAGARVTLDGQELGTAPVPEKTLFEGEHHLRVTRDEAVWENTFTLPGDQRLVFNVDFEE